MALVTNSTLPCGFSASTKPASLNALTFHPSSSTSSTHTSTSCAKSNQPTISNRPAATASGVWTTTTSSLSSSAPPNSSLTLTLHRNPFTIPSFSTKKVTNISTSTKCAGSTASKLSKAYAGIPQCSTTSLGQNPGAKSRPA